MKIPRLLHFIWVGSPVPDDVKRRWSAWNDMHPDWRICRWTGGTDDQWPVTRSLNVEHPVLRADFIRLEIVIKYGGVYMDSDTWPLRPVDPLSGDHPAWVSSIRSSPLLLNNAAFGAAPGNLYLRTLWDAAVSRLVTHSHSRLNYIAGPPLWTRTYLAADRPIVVLPPQAFTPISDGRAARKAVTDLTAVAQQYPAAYSIHEFAQAWRKSR